MGYSVSFQVETVQFTKTINSGNGNFADYDLGSFVIKNGDEQPPIKDATELGKGISDGQTIQLDSTWNCGVFQVSSGIPISAGVYITCQSGQSAADAKALHDNGLAQALDQLSVAVGVEGAIFGATGIPVGIALGIICAAISGVLQLAKDCIGDGPSPKSGLVFSGGLSYTVEAIQAHTFESKDDVGEFWHTTVEFKNDDGSSDCSVTFKVYRFYEQDPIFPPLGWPGKITPRVGAGPSEWGGVWGDNGRQDLAKIVCEIDQGGVPAAPGVGPRAWLYLASSEAAYRTAMAPAAFQLGGKRPAWQFSLKAFVPANPEAFSRLASSLSLKEGTAPGKSDLVLQKQDSPWSVPMQATKYAGPIFPGSKGTEPATFARSAATASVQPIGAALVGSVAQHPAVVAKSPTQVGPSPTQVALTQSVPGPPPAGMGQKAPAIEFADTICLPGNVFLQLYIVYNIAAPAKRWANRVRYLRLDSKGNTITDVLLDHTAPPVT